MGAFCDQITWHFFGNSGSCFGLLVARFGFSEKFPAQPWGRELQRASLSRVMAISKNQCHFPCFRAKLLGSDDQIRVLGRISCEMPGSRALEHIREPSCDSFLRCTSPSNFHVFISSSDFDLIHHCSLSLSLLWFVTSLPIKGWFHTDFGCNYALHVQILF